MKRFGAYLWYVLRHKWYVLRGCAPMRVPLWRGFLHDWTKFLPCEWFPYARHFFHADGTRRDVRGTDGSYDPNKQGQAFQRAWLHHQRNKHHWQAWITLGDGGSAIPLEIPEIYLREMIADWIGAGWALAGRRDPRPWYHQNKDKMVLHPESRRLLEQLMQEFLPWKG